MGSLMVAVRSLLISGVSALPEFSDVEATFGYKTGSRKRLRCWTQNAHFTIATAGLRPVKTFRDESGTFDLVILVEGIGKSVEATSARAVEVGTAAEDWIATRANWDGRHRRTPDGCRSRAMAPSRKHSTTRAPLQS
jgi:hypothetical protein